jgi:hypothetical protein
MPETGDTKTCDGRWAKGTIPHSRFNTIGWYCTRCGCTFPGNWTPTEEDQHCSNTLTYFSWQIGACCDTWGDAPTGPGWYAYYDGHYWKAS